MLMDEAYTINTEIESKLIIEPVPPRVFYFLPKELQENLDKLKLLEKKNYFRS